MMFRKAAAAAWLFVACLAANAHAIADAARPSVVHAPVQYPSSAVAATEEGTVLLAAEVDASGRVVDAKIDKSSGYPDLDAAALQSIPQWSFRPATRDGRAVAQRVVVPVSFQLKRETAGVATLLEASSAMTSALLGALGSLIWVAGFVWSIVLAKRRSILWLSGMVALWVVTYPLFVVMHWSSARRSLMVVSLGIALLCLGMYLAPS